MHDLLSWKLIKLQGNAGDKKVFKKYFIDILNNNIQNSITEESFPNQNNYIVHRYTHIQRHQTERGRRCLHSS